MRALIFLCALAYGCSVIGIYNDYTSWNSNGDNHLSSYEFRSGYIKSNYFLEWRDGKKLNMKRFHNIVFRELDYGNDSFLSADEFNSKIHYYFINQFTENFSAWDDDNNNLLTKEEFDRHATKSSLFSRWDRSGDGRISEKEMATCMFSLCDVDNDRSVSVLEFNIWEANR